MAQTSLNSQKAALYAPNLPWNKFAPKDIGPCVMEFVADHEPYFRRWAEVFYENFQFLFGNHSIKWSKRYGFAVDYDFLRVDAPFELRAQTNLARGVCESLASFIFGQMPEWDVKAMDESKLKGKRFERIVQKLLDCYMERLMMDREFRAASMIYTLFGQFAAEVDWKHNAGQILDIPRYVKNQAPIYSTYMAPNPITGGLIEVPTQVRDIAGNPVMEDQWEIAVDAMGRQIVDKVFSGDLGVRMMTPYEYRRALGTYGPHRSRYWQTFKLMDYDEFLDTYKDIPGQTEYFNRIRPVWASSSVYSMAQRFFMRMQFTTPPTVDFGLNRVQNIFKGSLFKYKVFVVEHWDQPHPEKWPEGRRVVIANGDCTHITTPSYHTNKMDGWHPFAEAQWMTAAPSSMGLGPINDVIRKNKELDVKDSLIATAVRRNMGSQLLIKSGMGLDPQKLTGEPGRYHEVNDVDGARWLHDDMPIPPVIARLREMDKEDVYESSGAGDALRGSAETTATSGYQEQIRLEREQKRLSPARTAFAAAISTIGEKLVACLRANVIHLDESVMGYMKRNGAGEFSTQDVITFLSNNIDYGVDIKIDETTLTVQSKATKQATTMEVIKEPSVAQRLATNAKVLDRFLKDFGLEHLRDESAPHRDRAARENEAFIDMLRLGPNTEGIPRPLVIMEDDDDIHMAEHDEFLVENEIEFRSKPELYNLFLAHKEQHRLQKEEKLGKIMPGTSLQTATMETMASQSAAPTTQHIYLDTRMRRLQDEQRMAAQQAQAQQQAAGSEKGSEMDSEAPTGEKQSPQAPRQPSAMGGFGGNIDPNAPSQNTPMSVTRGGIT